MINIVILVLISSHSCVSSLLLFIVFSVCVRMHTSDVVQAGKLIKSSNGLGAVDSVPEEYRTLHNKGNLVFIDAPWNIREQMSKSAGFYDEFNKGDMFHTAHAIDYLLAPGGTAIIMCAYQQLHDWNEVLTVRIIETLHS
jgi:hypothetical protein